MLATGFAMGAASCKTSSSAAGNRNAAASIGNFGLQLYTLRDDLPKDPAGLLKQVAAFGYKEIESYEGEQGMFWGMGHTGFKKYMDDLGMVIVSSHCDIRTNFEKKAGQAGEIGMKYLIVPGIGPQKTADEYKKFAERFNACGEICKKNNLRFAYHNHGYTFVQTEGQMPQDILMQNTDPGLVDFEMDIYWVVTAGADPEAWMNKYPGRFRLCHVKDRLKTAPAGEADASCDLGTGSIDFSRVLHTAVKNGMRHFILEQERYDKSTPIQSAGAGAAYLKKLRI
jgi:sugar phosphate isomerase/epimerase